MERIVSAARSTMPLDSVLYALALPQEPFAGVDKQVRDETDRSVHAGVIASGTPANWRRANLMLVDDDPDILLTYEAILTGAGYNVDSFSSSERALSHFALKPNFYGVIIMDVRMLGIDGLELYRRVRTINQHSRVLFVTAAEAGSVIEELPDVKRSSILNKPVDSRTLLERVRAEVSKSPDASLWMLNVIGSSVLFVGSTLFLI